MELVVIENKQVNRIIYMGVPVMTVKMIAEVHGISVSNIYSNIRRYKDVLTKGVHFYKCAKDAFLKIGGGETSTKGVDV